MGFALKEVAEKLGVSENTLRRYLQRHGEVIPQEPGDARFPFTEESLLAFRGIRGLYGELREGSKVEKVLECFRAPSTPAPEAGREAGADSLYNQELETRLGMLAAALERAEEAMDFLQRENQRLQREWQDLEERSGVQSLETLVLLGRGEPEAPRGFFQGEFFSRLSAFCSPRVGRNLLAGLLLLLCLGGGFFLLRGMFTPSPSSEPLPSPVAELPTATPPPTPSSTPTPPPPTPTPEPPELFEEASYAPEESGESYATRLARKGILLMEYAEEEQEGNLRLTLRVKDACTLADSKFFVKRISGILGDPWELVVYCYDAVSTVPPPLLWFATYRPSEDDGRGYWKILPAK